MIREITITEAFSVRHPVLRPGQPLETCHFENDDLKSTKHFGFFERDNLIGIISVFKKNNAFFKENQFQIRGMAVLTDYQKKGIGAKLIRFAEHYIQKQKGDLIWLNARIIAVGFYEKLGYQIIGNPFEIAEIGTHYVMLKNIQIIL